MLHSATASLAFEVVLFMLVRESADEPLELWLGESLHCDENGRASPRIKITTEVFVRLSNVFFMAVLGSYFYENTAAYLLIE